MEESLEMPTEFKKKKAKCDNYKSVWKIHESRGFYSIFPKPTRAILAPISQTISENNQFHISDVSYHSNI